MAHALWSGSINFGLVTIPVKLFTAVRTDELSFNMLHVKDEGRIKYERACSVDGEPVPWDEIVKGYEFEKGSYVVLTDEDLIDAFREHGRREVTQVEPAHRTLVISPNLPRYREMLQRMGEFAAVDEFLRANYGHFALTPRPGPW